MKVLHGIAPTIFMIFLVGCLGNDLKSYGELSNIAGSENFEVKAVEWVDNNLPTGRLSDVEGRYHYGGGMAPASYWVENNFLWSEFGLAEHSQIRLSVDSANTVRFVLFQERSRIGIYVIPKKSLNQNSSLPVRFHSLSSRVGVFDVEQ